MTLSYVVHDGHAIFEGDIDLGPVTELHRYRGGGAKLGARWPNSTVFFRLDATRA